MAELSRVMKGFLTGVLVLKVCTCVRTHQNEHVFGITAFHCL